MARLATVAIPFLLLALAGSAGHRPARRQAALSEILLCRDQLQEALDAQRSATYGPKPKRSVSGVSSLPRAVREWAAKLKWRLDSFRATYAPASRLEDIELQLSAAALAIAERRFADAAGAMNVQAEPLEPDESMTRDRRAEILRAQGDAAHDAGDWSTALGRYREMLLRQPEHLGVVERAAECLLALEQVEGALRAYADLAQRLHDRGSRRMTQLDHRGALRDLNKAANLRLWLLEQGRQELAADLARSFSSCAAALIELQDLDRGSAYLGHAIDIYSQLSRLEKGSDLAGELANNHAAYASVLAELGKLDEAVVQAGHAIDILGRRVEQGQLDHGRKLASSLALRGLIHQTRGQQGAAAQDFERTAAALALVGGISEAIAWQEKALGLVDGDPRREAQLRLDRYRAAAPSGHARGSGL